jgi:hypothetical protein
MHSRLAARVRSEHCQQGSQILSAASARLRERLAYCAAGIPLPGMASRCARRPPSVTPLPDTSISVRVLPLRRRHLGRCEHDRSARPPGPGRRVARTAVITHRIHRSGRFGDALSSQTKVVCAAPCRPIPQWSRPSGSHVCSAFARMSRYGLIVPGTRR